ncbi:hypothetical protein JCM5353_002057 [Sporobolomyces roseus]
MSTDSTASPRQPTRYFDLLPLELIRHTIEYLAPTQYNWLKHQDNQKDLTSARKVSQLLRTLAQPLLFRIVEVNGNDDLGRLQRAIETDGVQLGALIRILIVSGSGWSSSGAGHQKALASSTQLLEELRCDCDFVDLKKLHLSGVELSGLPQLRFPHLKQLSFSNVEFPRSGLSSSSIPALSHFALYDDADYYYTYEISSFAALASHVTSMTFNLNLLEELPPLLFDTPSLSLLFDCHLSHSDAFKKYAARVKYLRIHDKNPIEPSVDEDRPELDMWKSWTTIFESKDSKISLRVLYLPLLPALEDTEIPSEESQAVGDLGRVCRRREIDVVFEDQPWPVALQSQLSEDLMRRSDTKRKVIEAGERVGGR